VPAKSKSKPRPKKRASKQSKSQHTKPLPPPIELPLPSAKPAEPESPGLLSGLSNLFQSPQAPAAAPQGSEDFSAPSSTATFNEPLSAESERILASVPDRIGGGEADDPGGPADVSHETDGLAALVGGEICDEQDVHQLLKMVGGFLADFRKCESYRIDDGKAGLIARPWAQVVNHLWVRYAPALLTDLSNSVPGLAKAVMLTSLVFGPAVMEDVKQSSAARANAAREIQSGPQRVARAAAPPPRPRSDNDPIEIGSI
jgi:hypothetical protein